MNTPLPAPTPETPSRQRKIRFIDPSLQRRLLVALVGFEVVLLSLAWAYLYYRLDAIVDANLYRVHFRDLPPIYDTLRDEALRIVGALVVVNALGMFIGDRLWTRRVHRIQRDLADLLTRTAALDLVPRYARPLDHAVIQHAVAWREAERERAIRLEAAVQAASDAVNRHPPDFAAYIAALETAQAEVEAVAVATGRDDGMRH